MERKMLKANLKAISTAKGSVLLEVEGNEKWFYVDSIVKPFLVKLKKGEVEYEKPEDTITFLKNTTSYKAEYKSANNYQNTYQNKSRDSAMMTRYATDIFIEAYKSRKEDFDPMGVALMAAEVVSKMHKVIGDNSGD
jgi:hypothetical protein